MVEKLTVHNTCWRTHICQAWKEERNQLKKVINGILALPIVISKILKNKNNWTAMLKYCEKIMLQKEEKKRENENLERDAKIS